MREASIAQESTKSKYVKEARERTIFYRSSILYIIALYMLPQYFGIPVPGFDLTAVRIMIIVLLGMILIDYDRSISFWGMVKDSKILLFVGAFLFVTAYTMVFRVDLKAFINPFIEFLELYLLMYVIKDRVGVDKTIKMIVIFLYILVILGIVEAAMQQTPFVFLNTIERGALYSGAFVRGGHYRIMSNTGHALGYGLLLMTAIPFAGIDIENKEYDIFKRPFLLIGAIANVFLTGSRSSLGILGLELFLMFVLSDRKHLKKNSIILVLTLVFSSIVLICIQSTSVGQYIMLQITSLIDSLFNTSFSVKYGADYENMQSSSGYRKLLWRIFKADWLNPILGNGKKKTYSFQLDGALITSLDNFYIVLYFAYAYPGLITFSVMLLYVAVCMLRDVIKTRSAIVRMLFIGVVCYYVHLAIADALSTLKYLYVLYAIYYCVDTSDVKNSKQSIYFGKKESKYVRTI